MSSTPMPAAERLQDMIDRQDIYSCLTRLSRGADRLDREAFLSAFHADAVVDVANFVGPPSQLYDWAEAVGSTSVLEHHYLLNHSCEIEGDVAHAETYFLYTARNLEETNSMAGGRYIDRFERRQGVWKIAFRYNMIEWGGTLVPGPVPFGDKPGLRTNGVPGRGKEDPSYRRPLTNLRELTHPIARQD